MRIKARLGPKKHAYIFGLLNCDQFSDPKPLYFVVDTGCTITTILPKETRRLGINYKLLERSRDPIITATSKVHAYILKNVCLIFLAQNTPDNELVPREFKVEKIEVFPPQENIIIVSIEWIRKLWNKLQGREIQKTEFSENLLGMDFLQAFKFWEYTENELILDMDAPT